MYQWKWDGCVMRSIKKGACVCSTFRWGYNFASFCRMSWSSSEQPVVLSNCISDALLPWIRCPILLSHRLAATWLRKQSFHMEDSEEGKQNLVNIFIYFFPENKIPEQNQSGFPSPSNTQARLQCQTSHNMQRLPRVHFTSMHLKGQAIWLLWLN